MFTDVTLLLQTGGYLVKRFINWKEKENATNPNKKAARYMRKMITWEVRERQGSLRHAHHSPFGAAPDQLRKESWRPGWETESVSLAQRQGVGWGPSSAPVIPPYWQP